MKSDTSIKNIALAVIKRHSINLEGWNKTKVDPDVPFSISYQEREAAVVLFEGNEENWTLVTTQRIIGKIDNIFREVDFAYLDNVIFGNYKSTKTETTNFRIVDIYGQKQDFLMEAGQLSMAYIYGIQTIDNAFKTSA